MPSLLKKTKANTTERRLETMSKKFSFIEEDDNFGSPQKNKENSARDLINGSSSPYRFENNSNPMSFSNNYSDLSDDDYLSSYDNYDEDDSRNLFEEYEEEPIGDRIKNLIDDNSQMGLMKKWLMFFIPILYITLWSGQRFVTMQYSDLEVSIWPHMIIYNVLHNQVIFIILIGASIAMACFLVKLLNQKIDERNQWEVSANTTHGSAVLSDDKSIEGAVEFKEIDKPEGVCLGRKISGGHEESVCVTRNLGRNMNFAVFGSSGSGKSYSFSRPNILTRIYNGDSYIVTDPSGELYTDTAALAEKKGYTVKVLNLKNPTSSNGWNPLDVLFDSDPIAVQTKTMNLVHTILVNTTEEGMKEDPFFSKAEENLLKALIQYVAVSDNFKGEPYERHLGTVYDLLAKLAAQEGILEEISELPDSDPAKASWKVFQSSGKLKSNFITGLASRIEIFQSDIIKEMFSHSEMDLMLPGEKKCAYYIVSSISSDKMRFLLSLFFSCAFESLITLAENNKSNKVNVPVYFLLDEFKAIGKINSFADKVANVRKYGISISMIFQDLNQLKQAYPNDYESILSNCDTWLVLGVNDEATKKRLSERTGIATVVSHSYSEHQTKHRFIDPYNPAQNVSTSDQKRYVMNPDEIETYFRVDSPKDPRKAILFARGYHAYCMNSYDWHLHKLSRYVGADGFVRYAPDYIPEWQKNGDFTMNKKRTFLTVDGAGGSGLLFGGKSSEHRNEQFRDQRTTRVNTNSPKEEDNSYLLKKSEFAKSAETEEKKDIYEEAAKKPGGIVFSKDRSKNLINLGMNDLSSVEKKGPSKKPLGKKSSKQ